jgi:hypothetical protein
MWWLGGQFSLIHKCVYSWAATAVISSRVRPLNMTTSWVRTPLPAARVLAKPYLCRPLAWPFYDQ